jgi:hypothetical protein
MNDDSARILRSLGQFLLLAALTAAVPLIIYVDSVICGNGVSEYSMTELMEDVLLLLAAIMFFTEAWRRPLSRGFFVLVGGFFACMLIRELDFAFDVIRHGAWLYVALLTAMASVALAIACRTTVFAPMAAYADTKSCIYVSIGLLIVMVFSRLFGSGRLIWTDIMGTDYKSVYKAIIQEGLELFGYVFVGYGSCLLPREH